jgi:VanZ family protein
MSLEPRLSVPTPDLRTRTAEEPLSATGTQRTRRILLAWLPVVSYTLLIWWLSSQQIDFAFMERVPFQDKGVHFLEYGALSFFNMHAISVTWPERRFSSVITATLITAGLGLLDELHQSFVPGRSSDVYDLAADLVGAAVAALVYVALSSVWRSLSQSRERPRVGR